MKKTQKKTFWRKAIALTLGLAAFFSSASTVLLRNNVVSVSANAVEETLYYDSDTIFNGYGTQVSANYSVACDEMRRLASAAVNAPSYGNGDPSMSNICGPITGTNIVVFFDQYKPNLIPNFEPGMISYGAYDYFPDMAWDETEAVLRSLYTLMKIPEVGGTTSANFKNGLSTYMSNAGYSFSYTSFYDSPTTVNLTQLTTALNAGKIGVILCSQYNFVYGILHNDDLDVASITKNNSTTGHIMMVYGYETLGYYVNGECIRTETFLCVSSGYQTAEKGYMKLNDFSDIDEALILTVS